MPPQFQCRKKILIAIAVRCGKTDPLHIKWPTACGVAAAVRGDWSGRRRCLRAYVYRMLTERQIKEEGVTVKEGIFKKHTWEACMVD